jgi:hypothetical protein
LIRRWIPIKEEIFIEGGRRIHGDDLWQCMSAEEDVIPDNGF